ncbi:MAG: glutamate racemase [Actinomycetota bacterium]|nr:glutamate racemase [Actinomycetota bacterium]
MSDARPIGVFDSGSGGLTVARAILDSHPGESLLYVGDTARFPYGPRSLEEIRGYALEIAAYLVGRNVKMLVVACNSIEVAAIEEVTRAAGLPVVGVIDPGVRAAVRATHNGRVGLIGTEATVRSGAYERAVARTGQDIRLVSQACPVFVEYVERGDTASEELFGIARDYLAPLQAAGVDTLILGCTHYPLLAGLISFVMGPDVRLISSAEETAKDVFATLLRAGLLSSDGSYPSHEFVCTGDPVQFRRIAEVFLGPSIPEVRVAVPGGFQATAGVAPWS